MPGAPAGLHQALDQLLRNAHRDLLVVGVERGERSPRRGGGHAAEKAVLLDQDRLRPGARRGERGDQSRRAAARDDDVRLTVHPHFHWVFSLAFKTRPMARRVCAWWRRAGYWRCALYACAASSSAAFGSVPCTMTFCTALA